MISVEKITKYKIRCEHCGGEIKMKSERKNEFDKLLTNPDSCFSNSYSKSNVEIPTCIKCGRKFKIAIDVKNFEIIVEDYK